MPPYEIHSSFSPKGDQPAAIDALLAGCLKPKKHQVLLGITGSGKTFTMAKVIEKMQRPTLIMSPNKTLAAQLYQEFRGFFPNNAIHYFVSYYDYYQPEAYIPHTDTYIEKDAKINDVIDRLRHEAVQDVLSRKDAIVVASVSCIYNIGSPEDYQNIALNVKINQKINRKEFLSHLTALQYQRNDIEFGPDTFRIRGEIIEVFIVTGRELIRLELSGDTIESLAVSENSIAPSYSAIEKYTFYPAKFWVTPEDKLKIAMQNIRLELQDRLQVLRKENTLVEAQRLQQRTNYDLELIEESGYCHGIENYSRHFDGRKEGEPPYTLLSYFPKDFLTVIDESHVTVPQLRGMYAGDRSRKRTLVEFGFRLPSALGNRPMKFNEFEKLVGLWQHTQRRWRRSGASDCRHEPTQRKCILDGAEWLL